MSTTATPDSKAGTDGAPPAPPLDPNKIPTKLVDPPVRQLTEAERLVKKIELMDPVLWYESGQIQDQPYPAIVIRKGDSTLSLVVFDEIGAQGIYRKVSGAKWVKDPTLKPFEQGDQGAFDVSPKLRLLWDILAKMPK